MPRLIPLTKNSLTHIVVKFDCLNSAKHFSLTKPKTAAIFPYGDDWAS
jgi:hypothetical protein